MIATQSLSSSVLLPLLCPTPPVHSRVARSQLSDFEFVSKLPSITFLSSHKFSKRTRTSTVRGINSNDPKESAFFDENGVVEDMDSYLNYLSLEYDSVWDTKPSWSKNNDSVKSQKLRSSPSCAKCEMLDIDLGHGSPMWTDVAYSNMIEERRKRVTKGLEDTYGERKSQ
ncbi:hypothetical protein MTR67_040607 [Solanum verrucosum]|uniref:Uncharacterized protein n=1 Tax=Solanum verrucosum TaxID=315347 RepID=A0AAF0ZPK3_SOLVR|nr:hypothetical protein MTR67_040607 [Solanum verrucosum]